MADKVLDESYMKLEIRENRMFTMVRPTESKESVKCVVRKKNLMQNNFAPRATIQLRVMYYLNRRLIKRKAMWVVVTH